MYELVLSKKYQKGLEKITSRNVKVKLKISKTLKLLLKDIDHPSLRLHKLSGEGEWSISVTGDIRILLYIEKSKIYLLRIGKHEEVYDSIQQHSAVYCGDELNADNAVAVPSFAYMSSSFGGIPRSLERGGCH